MGQEVAPASAEPVRWEQSMAFKCGLCCELARNPGQVASPAVSWFPRVSHESSSQAVVKIQWPNECEILHTAPNAGRWGVSL